MNYQKEYKLLIKDIKDKLSKLSLSYEERTRYLSGLALIEDSIDSQGDDFAYYEAFLKAIKLEKKLTYLIYNKKSIVLPPIEDETYIMRIINNIQQMIKKYKSKNNYLKLRVISYILTGSVLLTAMAYTISKEKERSPERLYLTETTTYSANKDKKSYEYKYQKQANETIEVTIKKIMPWVMVDNKYQRHEYTYKIKNMTFDEIINSKNYENIIANLRFEEKVVSKSIDEMHNMNMYEEPLYEVAETVLDKDNYIERRPAVSTETIMALLSEIMIYLLILNVNNGPLLESIIIGSVDINSINEIIDAKKATLKVLKKQDNIAKKKTLKK